MIQAIYDSHKNCAFGEPCPQCGAWEDEKSGAWCVSDGDGNVGITIYDIQHFGIDREHFNNLPFFGYDPNGDEIHWIRLQPAGD